MKQGFLFISIALIIGYFAYQVPSFFLAWISESFFLVGLGYLKGLPLPFFKKSTGILPFWSKIINFPFLFYATFVWHLCRIWSRKKPTNRISDQLAIGRRLLSWEVKEEYAVYLDLTAEFEEPKILREKKIIDVFLF